MSEMSEMSNVYEIVFNCDYRYNGSKITQKWSSNSEKEVVEKCIKFLLEDGGSLDMSYIYPEYISDTEVELNYGDNIIKIIERAKLNTYDDLEYFIDTFENGLYNSNPGWNLTYKKC